MKKMAILLALIMVLVLPDVANAATPRILQIMPSISFSGTTAICEVEVIGNTKGDYIVVVAELWDGNRLLETWTASGSGYVSISEIYGVVKGRTYKLTVDVTFNGVFQPSVSATATC